MEFDAKLTGFAELAKLLRDIPEDIGKNFLRSANGAGAAVIRGEVKTLALAHKLTGTTARAVYSKQIREQSNTEKQVHFVGVRHGKRYQKVGKKGVNQDAYYFPFVELGHFTRPAGGGRLPKQTNRGQRNNAALASAVQSGRVKWVPARPILRPAFDSKKDAAVAAIGAKLADRISKYKAGK